MGCHRERHQRAVTALARHAGARGGAEAAARESESGQGTVEFALVTVGFLAVVVACGALWRALGDGAFVEHALTSASHHVQAAMPGSIADVFLY